MPCGAASLALFPFGLAPAAGATSQDLLAMKIEAAVSVDWVFSLLTRPLLEFESSTTTYRRGWHGGGRLILCQKVAIDKIKRSKLKLDQWQHPGRHLAVNV